MKKLKIESPNMFDALMMSMRAERVEVSEDWDDYHYDRREGRSAHGGY
jgi:hypothetical protein